MDDLQPNPDLPPESESNSDEGKAVGKDLPARDKSFSDEDAETLADEVSGEETPEVVTAEDAEQVLESEAAVEADEEADDDASGEPTTAEDAETGDEAAPAAAAEAAEGQPSVPPVAEDDESKDVRGPGWHLTDEELQRRISVLLFASPDPISLGKLVKLLDGAERARVKVSLETLTTRFEQADLGIQLRSVAGGHTLMSTPDLGDVVASLAKGAALERVSPAALETLSVVAYRQPVTKAEIEAIRGVQAGPILRTLVDRGLVRVTGRADVPGHPLQYGTTREFLDRFGLMSVGELPRDSELARG
ncbi:MAG: segregation and condensation protein B [Planctomycetota bacterium]|jgi:segregation and condensation protein B